MAASNQFNVYLPNELAREVEAARNAKTFDPKAVVKAALERAVRGEPEALVPDFTGLYAAVAVELGLDPARVNHAEVLERIRFLRSLTEQADSTLSEETAQQQTDAAFARDEITNYEVSYVESLDEVQAKLDLASTTGGWPISVAVTAQGQFLLVLAYPEGV